MQSSASLRLTPGTPALPSIASVLTWHIFLATPKNRDIILYSGIFSIFWKIIFYIFVQMTYLIILLQCMCVCVCLCMCVYVYLYICVYVCVCTHVSSTNLSGENTGTINFSTQAANSLSLSSSQSSGQFSLSLPFCLFSVKLLCFHCWVSFHYILKQPSCIFKLTLVWQEV